jgi:membrane-bound ClpP family serine protease
VDVQTRAEWIERGRSVRIVEARGNRVVVEEA